MLKVVKKTKHVSTNTDYYIGRTKRREESPLGNLFSHEDNTLAEFKVDSRDEAVDSYKVWILEKINKKDIAVLTALNEIIHMGINNEVVYLVCWCAPLRCHGEILVEILEQMISKKEYFKYK